MIEISFILNRDFVTDQVPADMSVLEYLRDVRGLTGTKESCGEGDCGACTIAVGTLKDGDVTYRAVNSCLLPAVRMHGRHIVTVEGLADGDRLHPVQQSLLDHHGVQCGFCTPGMVMSLFCLFLNNPEPSAEDTALAMDGTLCRCTGYASIQRAAINLTEVLRKTPTDRPIMPAYFAGVRKQLGHAGSAPTGSNGNALRWHFPRSEAELWQTFNLAKDPADRLLLGGGTDTMVALFDGHISAKHAVDLTGIAQWNDLRETQNGIHIGSGVTLSELLQNKLIATRFPALHQCLRQMCSTQVRNTATLAGNLCTASPISDTAPVLLVYEATVITASRDGSRRLPIQDFFTSYRHTALRSNEVVKAIEIPFAAGWSRFEKSGKRRTLDIATVSSAIVLRADGSNITNLRLAFGGVAAMPFLSREAATYLVGKPLTETAVERAASAAADEVHPISDVRGSAGFRRLLVRNHVIKHLRFFLDERSSHVRK
jgi:xanthine dehydrogenase small subunit